MVSGRTQVRPTESGLQPADRPAFGPAVFFRGEPPGSEGIATLDEIEGGIEAGKRERRRGLQSHPEEEIKQVDGICQLQAAVVI